MKNEISLPNLLQELVQTQTNKFSEIVEIAGLNLTEDFVGIDLSGEDLSNDNLSAANLSSADLSNTNLLFTNLSGANLSGADLSGANLRNANLSDANLSDANLTDANLSGVNLKGAILTDANLNGANLRNANLAYANLKNANLTDANLSGTSLQNPVNGINEVTIKSINTQESIKISLESKEPKEKPVEPLLETDKKIAQATSDLVGLETILDDVCREIQDLLGFDFVGISLVMPEHDTIEAVYGTGIASRWVDQVRHYVNADPDLRDIQAHIIKTFDTEIIYGWDKRFDRWVYERFNHERLNRVFTPIFLVHDDQVKVVEDWFEHYKWDENFIVAKEAGNNMVIHMDTLPTASLPEVIGTVEAGYENSRKPITYEQATLLAKLIARRALDIRRGRLSYVLETIAENAKHIFQADLTTLHFLWEPHQERYIYEVFAGDLGNIPLDKFSPRNQGLGWQSISERKPKYITYTSPINENSEIELNQGVLARGSRTYAAFPLLINDQYKVIPRMIATPTKQGNNIEREQNFVLVGVLYVHFRYEHEFIEELEEPQGQYFANRAVDAIWHVMTYQKIRDEARQLYTLQCITQSLNQIDSNLLSHIAWNTLNVLAADVVAIYEYIQTERQFLTPPMIAGILMQEEAMESEINENNVPFVLISRETNVYVTNIHNEPIFKNSFFTQRERIKSVASILLKVDKDIVGVMFINYRRYHSFSNEEQEIINSIASSAASAIKNQRWLQTLDSIEREIITTLDREKLLDLIVQKAVQNTGADIGVISILEPISQELVALAKYPANEPIETLSTHLKMGEGITGWVAMHRKAALVDDVEIDHRYKHYFAHSRSELCVPLLDKDCRVCGVLNVESRQRAKFKQRDLRRLELLAGLAVIAIQNSQNAEREVLATVGDVSGKFFHRLDNKVNTVKKFLEEIFGNADHNNIEISKEKGDTALLLLDEVSQSLTGMKIGHKEEAQPLCINSIINNALNQVTVPDIIQTNINVAENLPKVLGGEQQLIGMFYHLIQNAVDAMPNGGALSINARTVEGDEKLGVEVQVCDTGVGITPEKSDDIFQLGFTTKSDRGNTGLGLWLTKRQVETLGGVLKYESSLGQGSQFTVTLIAYIS
ncbi:pentapeptide repeat-containing protein [Nostoc sp.]|uniref:pentapeptide repeat-containing protein n=1 Tax=Nostoc sp. TaxID=1180 RepID=UPI002FF65421